MRPLPSESHALLPGPTHPLPSPRRNKLEKLCPHQSGLAHSTRTSTCRSKFPKSCQEAATMGSAPSACCSLPTMMANSNLLLQLFIQGREGKAKAAHGLTGLPKPRLRGSRAPWKGAGGPGCACSYSGAIGSSRAASTTRSLSQHTPGHLVASHLPQRVIEDQSTRLPAAPHQGRSDGCPGSTGHARGLSVCPGSGALPKSRA